MHASAWCCHPCAVAAQRSKCHCHLQGDSPEAASQQLGGTQTVQLRSLRTAPAAAKQPKQQQRAQAPQRLVVTHRSRAAAGTGPSKEARPGRSGEARPEPSAEMKPMVEAQPGPSREATVRAPAPAMTDPAPPAGGNNDRSAAASVGTGTPAGQTAGPREGGGTQGQAAEPQQIEVHPHCCVAPRWGVWCMSSGADTRHPLTAHQGTGSVMEAALASWSVDGSGLVSTVSILETG